MSRKGKLPITVPKGVEVKVDDRMISVKGPKGSLTQLRVPGIYIEHKEQSIFVTVSGDHPNGPSLHGLYRSLIENMVIGTTKGYDVELEMIGVGYRAAVKGRDLDVQVGFSHPTLLPIPEGIDVKVDKNTQVTVSGIDKQKVGQFAAKVRAKRPPEPYQGKGIRYKGEYVRKKAGKSSK